MIINGQKPRARKRNFISLSHLNPSEPFCRRLNTPLLSKYVFYGKSLEKFGTFLVQLKPNIFFDFISQERLIFNHFHRQEQLQW